MSTETSLYQRLFCDDPAASTPDERRELADQLRQLAAGAEGLFQVGPNATERQRIEVGYKQPWADRETRGEVEPSPEFQAAERILASNPDFSAHELASRVAKELVVKKVWDDDSLQSQNEPNWIALARAIREIDHSVGGLKTAARSTVMNRATEEGQTTIVGQQMPIRAVPEDSALAKDSSYARFSAAALLMPDLSKVYLLNVFAGLPFADVARLLGQEPTDRQIAALRQKYVAFDMILSGEANNILAHASGEPVAAST